MIPLTYENCELDFNGLCSLDTVSTLHPWTVIEPRAEVDSSQVIIALQKRIAEIDYDHDCFGN